MWWPEVMAGPSSADAFLTILTPSCPTTGGDGPCYGPCYGPPYILTQPGRLCSQPINPNMQNFLRSHHGTVVPKSWTHPLPVFQCISRWDTGTVILHTNILIHLLLASNKINAYQFIVLVPVKLSHWT